MHTAQIWQRWFHKYAHTVAFANNDDASLQLCGTDFQNVFLVLLFGIFIFACTQNMQKVLTVLLNSDDDSTMIDYSTSILIAMIVIEFVIDVGRHGVSLKPHEGMS